MSMAGKVISEKELEHDTLNDGLVAYYDFRELSGSVLKDKADLNNGTIVNATWNGQSLSFNGTTAYVNIPDAANLRLTNSFTISIWAKYDGSSTYSMIICKKSGSVVIPGYEMYHSNAAGGIIDFIGKGVGTAARYQRVLKVLDTDWHHYTFIMDFDGNMLIYYDGILQVPSLIYNNGILTTDTHNLWIGQRDETIGGNAGGFVAEVRVYNCIKTSQEIKILASRRPQL